DPIVTWTITSDGANVVIAATNHGTSPVVPPRDLLHLTIDGQESPDFADAFGNGFTKGGWRSLAAGATVDDSRGGLALGGAGTHTLVLPLLGHEVARTTTSGGTAEAWMGPSLFQLDAGDVTLSFSFDRPQGWTTDVDRKHVRFTSPNG